MSCTTTEECGVAICITAGFHAGFPLELQPTDWSVEGTIALAFFLSPLSFRWSSNLKECPLTTIETPQDFAPIAGPGECQNDLNFSSVADAVINKRSRDQASRAASARNASGRRRFVDPTTCEKDYNEDEMEFMAAMQLYKQASGRMFPTWSEVLEVLKGIGYEKLGPINAQA